MDLPTTEINEEVRAALIEAYSELNKVDRATVASGFDGGLPLDSILGVELACAMDKLFNIRIPERRLLNTRLYQSLRAFAPVVETCLSEQRQTKSKEGINERD